MDPQVRLRLELRPEEPLREEIGGGENGQQGVQEPDHGGQGDGHQRGEDSRLQDGQALGQHFAADDDHQHGRHGKRSRGGGPPAALQFDADHREATAK